MITKRALRSILLPKEKLSEKEKKELEEARKKITEDSSINLDELIKEPGCARS